MQLATFDQFAGTFGKVVPTFELTTSGQFKAVERFAQFVNVAQLSALYRQSVDVILNDDVQEFQSGDTLPRLEDQPESEGQQAGPGFTRILLPQTPGVRAELADIRATLRWFDSLTGSEKRENSHIPLVMYGQAKKATLDIRLLDPAAEDERGSKVNRAVAEIHRIYLKHADVSGTQLVFCDVFRSRKGVIYQDAAGQTSSEEFNVFSDISRKLQLLGIPAEEIAIVPADKNKRESIFAKVRRGSIRVLMGSSERMGVGVNVQERLAAIHHLDAPNRPTDFAQRNGRIIRQGNLFAVWKRAIEILTYGVAKTLDATAYGRLAMKQKFINQVLKGANGVDSLSDIADDDDFSSMNFEQMMATLSGSQTALLYTAKNHELTRLLQQKKVWRTSLVNAQATVDFARFKQKELVRNMAQLSLEAEIVPTKFKVGSLVQDDSEENEGPGLIESVGIAGGQTYNSRKEWAEPLERYFSTLKQRARASEGKANYGTVNINGLDFNLNADFIGYNQETRKPEYAISYQWGLNLKGQIKYAYSFTNSLRAAIAKTIDAPTLAKEQLAKLASIEQEFSAQLNVPFRKQNQLDEMTRIVDELKLKLESETIDEV